MAEGLRRPTLEVGITTICVRRLLAGKDFAVRKVFAVLLSVAVLGALAVGPMSGVAQASNPIVAWVNQGTYVAQAGDGRYYAHWQCDVGGTVVAAGIWWVWLSDPATAIGALAGISFDVGCHIGAPDVASYMVGVPYERTAGCAIVYPHGSYARRYTACIL
jgi:hypothetical protein